MSGHEARQRISWGVGIALGMGVGVALGVAMDNVAVGAVLGVVVGVVVAFFMGGWGTRRPKDGGGAAGAGPDDAVPDGSGDG